MKAREVAELTDEELARRVRDLKQELFNLRFQKATGQLDNPMRLREVRRDVARVLTIQRLRELERAQGGEPAPPGPGTAAGERGARRRARGVGSGGRSEGGGRRGGARRGAR
ncbi:MAG: 50S ribosomal protein L29 [Clostridia bacterium]|nr:50S ribosomal protein L29 [Clostridia bacterium]